MDTKRFDFTVIIIVQCKTPSKNEDGYYIISGGFLAIKSA
jgi:hypothetical protein